MIQRFSSRRKPLGQAFLNERLRRALRYDRIAGYFRSSIFEIAGEAFENMPGPIRIVCNTGLDERDVKTAQGQKMEFYAGNPIEVLKYARHRYERLAQLLQSKKVGIRVLPDEHFGLIHGKAGVITFPDESKACFLGSINETRQAWTEHYELLWEDDDPEAVRWVQEEFEALWKHSAAQPLSEVIFSEVERILRRKVVSLAEWKAEEEPSAPFSEAAVNREGPGLMSFQKYFVLAVMREIQTFGQARFLLADGVGMGKTLQLGMAAEIVALTDERPVLILCPKNLTTQWQDELKRLLGIPTARWDGGARLWMTDAGVEYPHSIANCPRKIGIVATSLITAEVEYIGELLKREYSCVILDEAHRARMGRSLGHEAEPTKLLRFMRRLAGRTKTLLLGTATPIQMDRKELFDLMDLLHVNCPRVLGGFGSPWTKADDALNMVAGLMDAPDTAAGAWRWFNNPLPPEWEPDSSRTIRRVWEELDEAGGAPADRGLWLTTPSAVDRFSKPLQERLVGEFRHLIDHHNPFIRHTIKRPRDLVTKPQSGGLPYFKEIYLATDDQVVEMPPEMAEAYGCARDFCRELAARKKGMGILKTLILRRIGSSLAAGLSTAIKILGHDPAVADEEDEEQSGGWDLTSTEQALLQQAIERMRAAGDSDPKLRLVVEHLRDRRWLEKGCIVFSQYFDSVWWLAKRLAELFPNVEIGVYGGGTKCYLLHGPEEEHATRDQLKDMVQERKLRVLVATDAASEGLNLQKLETLINLDLPWNPARLEQRKGRINRIGQTADTVFLLNLRYSGSVEDDVHNRLSRRLQQIHQVFGTLPDMLEDVWVTAALENMERAESIIEATPKQHPFNIRYGSSYDDSGWDECASVLNRVELVSRLQQGWR